MNTQHYEDAAVTLRYEPIVICQALDFCAGNAFKYLTRAPFKGEELEDLKKARYYLVLLKTIEPSLIAGEYYCPFIRHADKRVLSAFTLRYDCLEALFVFSPQGDDLPVITNDSIDYAVRMINERIDDIEQGPKIARARWTADTEPLLQPADDPKGVKSKTKTRTAAKTRKSARK